ncbi:hypothetical protein LTR78_008009 [Recurvomyces mirabilis]|uniref:Uncharacterized protein n=1 Tax=Recurvomyces mirabilis TaxID=574656 RepID=A0AAE0TQR2_9PEZI|nr:hypothetical protein LTR78_008009 [Recurvomyces mirabilis]KAK5150736.1 hypothetical protein LTS14_009799 [Recurvomyces mirabilis]
MKSNPNWERTQAESQGRDPGTLSGVLAWEWQLQHRLAGMYDYWRPLGLSEEVVFNSINKLNMIILPTMLGPPELIGIGMACVGYNGHSAGNNMPDFLHAHKFAAGSDCYNMLLGTQTTKSVVEFLYEHRAILGRKVISSIIVYSNEPADQELYPTMLLVIQDYTDDLGEAWIAEQQRQPRA